MEISSVRSQANGSSAAQARRRHFGLQWCGLGRRDGDDRPGVLQLQARESLAGSCNAPCSGCGLVQVWTGMEELSGIDRSCKSSAVAPQTWPRSRGPTRAGVHCRLKCGHFFIFKWGDGVKMRDG
jgi:hypothetical protein